MVYTSIWDTVLVVLLEGVVLPPAHRAMSELSAGVMLAGGGGKLDSGADLRERKRRLSC